MLYFSNSNNKRKWKHKWWNDMCNKAQNVELKPAKTGIPIKSHKNSRNQRNFKNQIRKTPLQTKQTYRN